MKSDPDVQIDRAVYRDGAWSLTIRCPHWSHQRSGGYFLTDPADRIGEAVR